MAVKTLRPCRKPGCPELTRQGWCDKHKPIYQRGESADWHWMYGTPLWKQRLRPTQLLREPFCRMCAAEGHRTRATVADHIVPHRGDWALFSDPDNLQSVCKRHHDQKTMQEQRERAQKSAQK